MSKFKEKRTKKLILTLFGLFFATFLTFSTPLNNSAYADPLDTLEDIITPEENKNPTDTKEEATNEEQKEGLLDIIDDGLTETFTTEENKKEEKEASVCKDQSGAIGWLICPTTGVMARASDAIYSIIEDILIINPTTVTNESTVHIVWQYMRDITNIVFILFLLVVVISHLTGFGISNYNLKRILPRLIIVAILVNVSFIICQLAIDISNILGASIRGTFTSIEEQAIANGITSVNNISWTDIISAVTGTGIIAGSGIAITGGLSTLFWTLVPILLGALLSVIIGLITISLRQGLVMVLAMIAPLAFVCFLLPNTEGWFKKWKSLFMKMLTFYPMFSFLFGASHIAGWAIATSSVNAEGETSGFGVIVGLAVQIFPLFGSWSLMKMSGTILGNINQKLNGIAAKPLGAFNRSAMLNRNLAKSKYFGGTPKGVSQEVMQKINNRQIRKMEDTKRYNERAMQKGITYASKSMLNSNGHWTKRAINLYEQQAESLEEQKEIEKIKGYFNKGLGQIDGTYIEGTETARRLKKLDIRNMNAADNLKYQLANSAKIEIDNAESFYTRTRHALDAHIDQENMGNERSTKHKNITIADSERYSRILLAADNNKGDAQYIAADAAYTYNSHRNVAQSKYNALNTLTAPTQDIVYQLKEITSGQNPVDKIDTVVSGMRTLNDRGDTNLITNVLDDALNSTQKIQLGTYASQQLSSFFMFEVKDKDPFLRRFGKYLNIETARAFNEDVPEEERRRNLEFNFDEYITGKFVNYDKYGNIVEGKSKISLVDLIKGTSFKGVERTAFDNITARIRKAYTDADGNVNMTEFIKKQQEFDDATFANLIGDQFGYLSGSEQITSFARYITGVSKNKKRPEDIPDGQQWTEYVTDWDKIFGKGAEARLTQEDKNLYESFQTKRTFDFLHGQVANQVARTKSDVLSVVMGKFKMDAAHASPNENEEFYKEKASEYFINSLNTDVYDNLVSMYDKGFQGDTKANLVENLKLNDPRQIQRVRNKKRINRGTSGQPGQPQPSTAHTLSTLATVRNDINRIYQNYQNANQTDVNTFWLATKRALDSMANSNILFGDIDASINTYTNVTQLYQDIMSRIGGQ